MALQLSDLRQSLLNRKKDLSDVSTTVFIEWCNYVADFAYDHVKGVDPERFIDDTNTYTVSSDPQTTALPSDFHDIGEWGTGFFLLDSESKDTDKRLVRSGPGQRIIGYYIEGTNVIFTGLDDSSVYRLRYLPQRTRFTAEADYFTIDALTGGADLVPNYKTQYLVDALDVLYSVWDEEVGAEGFADARFVRSLGQLLSHIKKEPSAYGLYDFSNYY